MRERLREYIYSTRKPVVFDSAHAALRADAQRQAREAQKKDDAPHWALLTQEDDEYEDEVLQTMECSFSCDSRNERLIEAFFDLRDFLHTSQPRRPRESPDQEVLISIDISPRNPVEGSSDGTSMSFPIFVVEAKCDTPSEPTWIYPTLSSGNLRQENIFTHGIALPHWPVTLYRPARANFPSGPSDVEQDALLARYSIFAPMQQNMHAPADVYNILYSPQLPLEFPNVQFSSTETLVEIQELLEALDPNNKLGSIVKARSVADDTELAKIADRIASESSSSHSTSSSSPPSASSAILAPLDAVLESPRSPRKRHVLVPNLPNATDG